MKKFHDYDWQVGGAVWHEGKGLKVAELFRLTGLPKRCSCLIYPLNEGWVRKTVSYGGDASTRYYWYRDQQKALDAGIAWAHRKDREVAAANARGEPWAAKVMRV